MGHSAVTYRDSMFLFGGGECQDSPQSCLWKFSFISQRWSRVTSLPGSAPPEKIHHCCAGIGRGYASSTVLPAQTGNSFKLGKKCKVFKNRCCPVPPPFQNFEDAIELQALGSDGSSSSDLEHGFVCRDIPLTSELQLNCTQEALGGKEEDEDFSEHLPDLLLVLGGRPVSHHSPISVWQMTLTDC